MQPAHSTHSTQAAAGSPGAAYRMPRLARASRPGSYALIPSVSAFSMSMVPQMRSSAEAWGGYTCRPNVSVMDPVLWAVAAAPRERDPRHRGTTESGWAPGGQMWGQLCSHVVQLTVHP